jgi:hypothetical protein
VAVANVFGINSSKPARCTFKLTTTDGFSDTASTNRKKPSAASGETGKRPMSSTTISRARRIAFNALLTERRRDDDAPARRGPRG